jgi:hypothetical protein
MSIRTATMSNVYSPSSRRPGFFRKLVVTLLFVVAITGLMALFYVYQKNLSRFWMTVLATLSIGLASGSMSRLAFYRRSGFLRFFAVLLSLPLGLFLLGVFTNWHMGIGPLNPWAKGIIRQSELIQLGGAFLVAFICLDAWWKPPSRIKDGAAGQYSNRSREPMPVAIQEFQPRRQAQSQENFAPSPKKDLHLKFMKASKTRSRKTSSVDKLFLTNTAQAAGSKRKRMFSRKPNLQISLYEEHRCPFCLDEVKQNDPRGVKKCEVCNTLHHADCWAITGMCQVPHLNT